MQKLQLILAALCFIFHTPIDYKMSCNEICIKKIKEKYKGYILNSNWADEYEIHELGQRLPITYYRRTCFGNDICIPSNA